MLWLVCCFIVLDMEATLFCVCLVSESSSKWPQACVVLLNNVKDEGIIPSIGSVRLTPLKCSSCQLQCQKLKYKPGDKTVVQTFWFLYSAFSRTGFVVQTWKLKILWSVALSLVNSTDFQILTWQKFFWHLGMLLLYCLVDTNSNSWGVQLAV